MLECTQRASLMATLHHQAKIGEIWVLLAGQSPTVPRYFLTERRRACSNIARFSCLGGRVLSWRSSLWGSCHRCWATPEISCNQIHPFRHSYSGAVFVIWAQAIERARVEPGGKVMTLRGGPSGTHIHLVTISSHFPGGRLHSFGTMVVANQSLSRENVK